MKMIFKSNRKIKVVSIVLIILFSSIKSYSQEKDIEFIRSFFFAVSHDSISERIISQFIDLNKEKEVGEIKFALLELKNQYSKVLSNDTLAISYVNKQVNDEQVEYFETKVSPKLYLLLSLRSKKIYSIMTFKEDEHKFIVYL